jgi:hypothetical protein
MNYPNAPLPQRKRHFYYSSEIEALKEPALIVFIGILEI